VTLFRIHDEHREKVEPGLHHLGFEVEDLEAVKNAGERVFPDEGNYRRARRALLRGTPNHRSEWNRGNPFGKELRRQRRVPPFPPHSSCRVRHHGPRQNAPVLYSSSRS
jgi:hypothetical protein